MSYIHCQITGLSRHRDVCENLCRLRKEGRLDRSHARCSAAIGKHKCPVVIELFPKRKRKKNDSSSMHGI